MNNKLLSNGTLQHLIAKSESEKRGAFLAGMAYILEELDTRFPDWDLRSKTPELLAELNEKSKQSNSAPKSEAEKNAIYCANGELL